MKKIVVLISLLLAAGLTLSCGDNATGPDNVPTLRFFLSSLRVKRKHLKGSLVLFKSIFLEKKTMAAETLGLNRIARSLRAGRSVPMLTSSPMHSIDPQVRAFQTTPGMQKY